MVYNYYKYPRYYGPQVGLPSLPWSRKDANEWQIALDSWKEENEWQSADDSWNDASEWQDSDDSWNDESNWKGKWKGDWKGNWKDESDWQGADDSRKDGSERGKRSSASWQGADDSRSWNERGKRSNAEMHSNESENAEPWGASQWVPKQNEQTKANADFCSRANAKNMDSTQNPGPVLLTPSPPPRPPTAKDRDDLLCAKELWG